MLKTKFSYTQTIKRRNALFGHVFSPRIGTLITGEHLNDMTDAVLLQMPKAVTKNAVFESLRAFAGTQISQKTAGEISWRLAGNIQRLIDGIPVLPWTRQIEDEMVPVQVERVISGKRKEKLGYYFTLRAVAGSPCPISFTHFISRLACKMIIRAVGFSGMSWGKHPYANMSPHFTGLLFFAHVEAERSREQPYFHNVSASSSMLKRNKALLDVRCRVKPCPFAYQHHCVDCHIGYLDCQYSTHKNTYDLRHCSCCDKEAFFDPKIPAMMCIRCQHANR